MIPRELFFAALSVETLSFSATFVLMLALLYIAWRRREIQHQLEARLGFERLLLKLTLALTAAPPARIGDVLQTELVTMAPLLGVDRVWCWSFPMDAEWDSPPLRAGETAMFDRFAALPPSLAAMCETAGMGTIGRAVAVPLALDGVIIGALFCVARAGAQWRADVPALQMIATTIANLVQHKRVERELGQSDRLK